MTARLWRQLRNHSWAHDLSLLVPLISFFIVLLVTTIPRGLQSSVSAFNVPVMTWSSTAAKIFGGSDAGSLLTAAISLRGHGNIDPSVNWVYNLWPPGMVGVDRVLLILEDRLNIPIVLLMVLLNCAVWALFLGCCFNLIRSWHSLFLAMIFGAGVLLYSGVNSWGVRNGLFYSDSFGSIAYCLCLLFILMLVRSSSRRRRVGYAALSGISLAAAAYFRATFEVLIDATLVVSSVVMVIALISRAARKMPRFTSGVLKVTVPMTVVSTVAQLAILPWRIFAGLKIHPGDFRWSVVSDLASDARWVPSSVLETTPSAGFLLNGHSNWACLDDAVECAKIYALEKTSTAPYSAGGGGYFTGSELDRLTIKSILGHPFNYLFERIDALSFGFASNTGGNVKDLALPESIILVGLAIATIFIVARAGRFTNPAYVFFYFGTAVQFATIAVLHMEPRYFLGIELSIVVVAPFALMERRRLRSNPPPNEPGQFDSQGLVSH